MAKLYVFGIGGTGSRVIRAFTMLLAAGVKFENRIDQIIPIIIDPDIDNGDKTRTNQILSLYHNIRSELDNPNDFFSGNIKTLRQIGDGNDPFLQEHFNFKIKGADDNNFRHFIGINSFSNENTAFSSLLFSRRNLNAEMRVGFKGNPNIGSVVLNQFVESDEFLNFAQTFQGGDLIFIISSIFGGTGAAGFPLLLKNLRGIDNNIPNANAIRNASIGAITVLPYFNVDLDRENSEIDSDTFMEKAKAAISYYNTSIINNNELNGLYFIGDLPRKIYTNCEGSVNQKNDAHFIELASALSIFDFIRHKDQHQTDIGKTAGSYFKEFGIERDADNELNFKSLGEKTRQAIMAPMSKFKLASLFLRLGRENSRVAAWMRDNNSKTNIEFFTSIEYENKVEAFLKFFNEWIEEMSSNEIAFKPFNNNVDVNNALDFISGYKANRGLLNIGSIGLVEIDKEINNLFNKHNKNSAINQLIKTLEYSTERVLRDKRLI